MKKSFDFSTEAIIHRIQRESISKRIYLNTIYNDLNIKVEMFLSNKMFTKASGILFLVKLFLKTNS